MMIIVTGGAGFIGNATIWKLNQQGISDIIIADELGCHEKWRNLLDRQFIDFIHKSVFLNWLRQSQSPIEAVIHLGACSTTTEKDADFLMENNTQFTLEVFRYCSTKGIPLIYASSAATYGNATTFSDDHTLIPHLRPNNKYGFSKHLTDCWTLRQGYHTPPRWYGLKFFNVFGPGEWHKGSQTSVAFQAFHQIQASGTVKLFKSHRQDYDHGEQQRDFIYIKDVVDIIYHFLNLAQKGQNGIYNVGTGIQRSFKDLALASFAALEQAPKIDYIDMPEKIRKNYQYFTKSDITKLRRSGYKNEFYSLECGISDYLKNYLQNNRETL